MNKKNNIAIFASANASNLLPIYEAIKNNVLNANITLLITNNKNAPAILKARKLNIPTKIINDKTSLNVSQDIYNELFLNNCKYVVLSGYMKKLDSIITNNFTVINSHPSLLPSYGGIGMYGRYVHEAVIKNKEKYSGTTIHYVNKNYDEGEIILQEKILLDFNETIDTLEFKIKNLEKELIIKALKQCLK
jgi:phosphoribosylglycinamide formyltransferase-1